MTFGISLAAYTIFVVESTDSVPFDPTSSKVSPISRPTESEFIALLTTEKITQDRDLSLYEFGGKREVFDNSISEFILKHWQTKKRGYILVGSSDSDFKINMHIFIEPDNAAHWRIAIRRETFVGTNSFPPIVEDLPDIRSTKRKQRTTCVGEKTHLILLDKDKNEVFSILSD